MNALLETHFNSFLVFVFVLTRISGLAMTAPVYGSKSTPVRVRALLAVSVSLLITTVHWDTPVPHPGNLVNLIVMMGREAVLGLCVGLSVVILFTGLQLAGQIIGQMSGMQLADFFDPNFDASVPIVARILDMITLAVFITIGGHRLVMSSLLETFSQIPPGAGNYSPDLTHALQDIVSLSFSVGVRVAAPVMISLLMSMLILGLISRTLPQLNILAVGFNLNSMMMLATLSISLGGVVWLFQDELNTAVSLVQEAIQQTKPFGT